MRPEQALRVSGDIDVVVFVEKEIAG